MSAISTDQMRMMYGLARKAGIDNDNLHAMVYQECEKDSIKQLTSYEGKRVIDRLLKLTGQEPATPAARSTTRQQRYLFVLAKQLGWGDDKKRLRGFLKARFGVEDVAWLTDAKCQAAIEAMKAMIAGNRGERKRGAQ